MLHGVSPDEAANARGPIVIPTILSGFLQSIFFIVQESTIVMASVTPTLTRSGRP
jgi:hypothetical protein